MEFRQVQYFICLFEEGTVTRAARRLNIVQPALSMQIARLEDELRQKLFERTRKGMVPTALARQMYRQFLPVMRDFAQARAQVMSADGEISGSVKIGVIGSITEGVMAETLGAFSETYPAVEVTVLDGYSRTLSDWVAGGHIDVAIINKPRGRLGLDVEHIVDEEMLLISGAGRGAPLPPRLTLAQIASLGRDLVLPTREHGLRAILDSFAQHADVDLTPKFEIDSLVTTVKLVEQSELVTILPHICVHRPLMEGRVHAHEIASPRITRQVVAVTHPRRPLNSATAAFVAMLTQEMRSRTRVGAPGELPAPS
ncbi:LysR family transcriptional regulator [Lacisediminimonas profundi]|uniref:LysR family transcriptional regulator n=1 Tax=Lacisediminimonas profundi TaxID=2603856 RepID=UPI00124B3760|nr:LysR family transcriptional regulator [Lacisediminimonas profundi]